ncbi:hypothetical protein RHGRI_013426 [Rhododendron griersonianum]|uniref:Protein kinase domain-containing protein n=1 Tax=Rhododendron griersonianum TaxID=479676 RepID=A0AAV6K5Y0_9ERIC|nr:hypothetical protein RHGRI_013426 [Rhododendron griersonianum]
MTVEAAAAEGGRRRGRSGLVGIRIDGQSRELLDWALVKVADPGDHDLDFCWQVLRKAPPSNHNGKIVFRRSSNNQPPGHEGDPRQSFVLSRNLALTDTRSEFGDSEASEIARHSLDNFSPLRKDKALSTSSFSFASNDFGEQRSGWPLLSAVSPPAEEASKMSVVKWVIRLPNRSPPRSPLSKEGGFSPMTPIETGSPFSPQSNSSTDTSELLENLEKLFLKNSSGCKWFSYDVMKTSTSEFSSDKLIGKGGCNCVYKGILPDGKPVAVKVLKSSKESWKDFTREVDVMTSLSHKNITPLIGICVEDNALISVYDLLPKGNLEENLHGNSKEKSVLSWEVRCKVAVGIAEALNYLHNECSPPVIHRDAKSSNILLFDEFEPQLSDFGLAIWGPSDSSFLTDNDVVGTFGYLAPEYFMYGKVSDKIDVYSFGVVLLELLSGRKPISSESTKGQESLVMWAKPKLESGDLRSILDPNLDGNIDEVQIQRMALAARFCLIRSARLRPKMRQFGDRRGTENEENTDDEVYPHSSAESHLTLALLDTEDTSPSFSSGEQSSGTSSEEYLKGRWSRSSSLD